MSYNIDLIIISNKNVASECNDYFRVNYVLDVTKMLIPSIPVSDVQVIVCDTYKLNSKSIKVNVAYDWNGYEFNHEEPGMCIDTTDYKNVYIITDTIKSLNNYSLTNLKIFMYSHGCLTEKHKVYNNVQVELVDIPYNRGYYNMYSNYFHYLRHMLAAVYSNFDLDSNRHIYPFTYTVDYEKENLQEAKDIVYDFILTYLNLLTSIPEFLSSVTSSVEKGKVVYEFKIDAYNILDAFYAPIKAILKVENKNHKSILFRLRPSGSISKDHVHYILFKYLKAILKKAKIKLNLGTYETFIKYLDKHKYIHGNIYKLTQYIVTRVIRSLCLVRKSNKDIIRLDYIFSQTPHMLCNTWVREKVNHFDVDVVVYAENENYRKEYYIKQDNIITLMPSIINDIKPKESGDEYCLTIFPNSYGEVN